MSDVARDTTPRRESPPTFNEDLYRDLARYIRCLVFRMAPSGMIDIHDCDDVTHEIAVRFWLRDGDLREDRRWVILRAARNQIINLLRSAKKEQRQSEIAVSDPQPPPDAAEIESILDRACARVEPYLRRILAYIRKHRLHLNNPAHVLRIRTRFKLSKRTYRAYRALMRKQARPERDDFDTLYPKNS